MESLQEACIDPEKTPSVLMLNDDVLLKIFKFLNWEDAINLAECCDRLRKIGQMSYTKYRTLTLDGYAIKDEIDRIFSHIGSKILSLTIYCLNPNDDSAVGFRTFADINKIIRHCANLKKLTLSYWKNEKSIETVVSNTDYKSSLEELKLVDCDFSSGEDFLGTIRKLKYLSVSCCVSIDFESLFKNNAEIETFAFYANDAFLPDLTLLPKLTRVCLCLIDIEIKELYLLLRLEVLTKLKLCCKDNILRNFLFEFATKGTLEELEIEICVNEHFFKMMSLFKRLQLLIVNASLPYELKPSINWPTDLKALILTDFQITYKGLISLIQKLKSLQCINLGYSAYADSEQIHFNNVPKLGQKIIELFKGAERQNKLDIILPITFHIPGSVPVDNEFHSDRLSITDSLKFPKKLSDIQKYFPGINFYD